MKTSKIVTVVVVIVIILAGGYYLFEKNKKSSYQAPSTSSSNSTMATPPAVSSTPATTPASAPADATGDDDSAAGNTNIATLSIGDGTAGTFLTASNGMTLYAYAKDTANVSNCTGACLVNWPPYTVDSANSVSAIDGVNGKLATIPVAGGKFQVTYNGHPLYFFISDKSPGDTNGNGVNDFAVVTP